MDLAALRDSLRKLSPAVPRDVLRVETGIGSLDRALSAGGLVRGHITEIVGCMSSGKTALALSLVAQQTRTGQLAAFIDGTHQLYPPAAAAMGVELARLLVVKPPVVTHRNLVRAAEIIAQSRAFGLVVIDLPQAVAIDRVPARRLRTAAQRTSTAVVALATRSGSVDGASARLSLEARRGNRGQLSIAKGGNSSLQIEFPLTHHRFDDSPPRPIPEAIDRQQPGEEEQ